MRREQTQHNLSNCYKKIEEKYKSTNVGKEKNKREKQTKKQKTQSFSLVQENNFLNSSVFMHDHIHKTTEEFVRGKIIPYLNSSKNELKGIILCTCLSMCVNLNVII